MKGSYLILFLVAVVFYFVGLRTGQGMECESNKVVSMERGPISEPTHK